MRHLYKLLTICLLLPLFQSNASFSDELPKPKTNARKALDCGIPAPTIVNYGCLKKVWDKRFGGNNNDEHVKTIKLSDGYLVVGNSGSSISGDKSENRRGNSRDYWIIKIDNNGNKLWDKTYGGTGNEFLTDAVKLSDGGFILTGQSDSGISGDKTEASKGLSDYWIVKIDANGNKLWDKTYGGDNDERGAYVRETSDGLLIGGTSYSPISGNKTVTISSTVYHFWILKLDTQGNKLWEKQFGGTDNNQYVTSLEIVNSNEYLILGFSAASANTGNKTSPRKGGPDYWLVKIDSNGNKIWDQSYGGSSSDYPYSMVVSNDGKITIAGSTSSTVGNGSDVSRRTDGSSNNFSDAWIIQVDSDGNKLWDKSYGTSSGERATSIVLNNQGNYIISISSSVGNKNYDLSQDSRGQDDYWIMELNVNGSKLWDRSFGGFLSDYISSVNYENNNLIISGISYSNVGGDKSQSSHGQQDYWLVKMNYCQPTLSSSTTICKNDSTFLTVQGCSNASTVKWNNNETGQTLSVKPSVTTTYKAICISTETGCQSDSSFSFTVNVDVIPSPSVSVTNSTVCVGTNVTLTASGCSGGLLSWTGGLTGTSITVAPTSTKSYKVSCAINGCSSDSSTAATINVIPKPAKPTISSTGNTVCQGQSVVLTASACPNGTYGWTGGLTSSSITITSIGTKSYKVACTVNGCTSDSSLVTTVQINAKPVTPSIVPPTNTTICQGTSVSLTANGCSGGTLGWTGGITSTSLTMVLPVGMRTYKVACTINGCTSDSSSAVTITVNPKPAQPAINQLSQTICAGQSLNLTVTPISGNTYGWTGGLIGTSVNISPTTTKIYKVATSANGCTSDSSNVITITVQATSTAPTTTNAIVCEGGTLTTGNGLKSTVPNCSGGSNSVTATYSGGTVGYDGGNSSGNNPTATISGMSSTITKVRVSITWHKKGGSGDAFSCATGTSTNPYHGETRFKIQAPDGTIIDIINLGTYSGDYSSLVTTIFEDGFPFVSSGMPVSGTFSPASSLLGFNGKTPNGVWTLLPYDSGGRDPLCVYGFSVTVTAGSAPVPSTITWWNAQISGNQVGTGSEYLPATNTLASGIYTYYAQGLCTGLCPSPRIATTLTVSAKPATPTITSPTNSTICRGSSVTLAATGCAGGTYTWTGGLTGSSISVSPTANTNYVVTCTVNNCISDNSTAVTINVINNAFLETIKSGSWTDPNTWSCNRVPTATDDVIINVGHTVSDAGGTIRAKSLNYRGGILQFSSITNLILGN